MRLSIIRLTASGSAANTCGMKQGRGQSGLRAIRAAAVLVGGAAMLGGCISVNAPDKPIVIELNINIKQEVIYRLAADAGNTIESNPGIF